MIGSSSFQGSSRVNIRRGAALLVVALGVAGAGACTPGKLVSGAAKAPGVPGEGCDPKTLNEVNSPLVIEWPSDARSDLESAMRDGVVVVSFTCEKVKVLPDCKVAGSYGYRAVTPREESVLIEGRDNIQASFGGVSWAVGGSLERDAKLDLSYILVGKQSTILNSLHDKELEGGDFCKGATHFVKRADVGAFAYATGTRVAAGMSAKVMGQGASGSSENKEVRTKRDGDPATCKGSRLADEKAPEGCGAAIRVSLAPIKSGDASRAESLSKKGLSDGLGCPAGFVYADGACTKDAGKVKAFLCKEGDQQECQKQCAAGSDPSYDRLTRALHFNKKQATKGFDYMARGCVAGDFTSCMFLRFIGMDSEMKKETGIDGQKLLVQTIERGCRAGNAVPYGFLSVEVASGENLRRDPKRAIKLAESACRGSFAEACQIHAALLSDHERCEAILRGVNEKMMRLYHTEAICDDAVLEAIPDDPKKAAASLKRACDLGAQPACGG